MPQEPPFDPPPFDDSFLDGDDGVPSRYRLRGEPVPDLSEVPRDHWFAALVACSPEVRWNALRDVGIHGQSPEVAELMARLREQDFTSRRGEDEDSGVPAGTPIPSPNFPLRAPLPGRRYRQVSIRLPPEDHAQLVVVAEWLGMKPGRLVRTLVANGVRRLAYERRRARRS